MVEEQSPGQDQSLPEQVFVARQPVFDRDMRVWGYELLYRQAEGDQQADVRDDDKATSKVIADGIALGRSGLAPTERTLVNFPLRLILEGFGFAMSPENCVVEILETVPPTRDVLNALRKLKDAGYTLALDDFVGQPEHAPFLELADIVKVDVLALSPEGLERVAKSLGGRQRMLLAEKVETARMHDQTLDMGFHLFQGFFFQRPEIVSGRTLSASEISRVKLLKELADEDYDTQGVARIIQADLSLSYRLLRYINSASFGRRDPIDSIQRASMILGQRNLAKWLQAVLMSDMNRTPKGKELVFQSVRRAKFLELLGRVLRQPPARPDALFVLGLFSLLDSLLGMPMDQVTKDLPLTSELVQALQGEPNPSRLLLDLALDLEHADWRSVRDMMFTMKLPFTAASAMNADALRFAGELVRSATTTPPQGKRPGGMS